MRPKPVQPDEPCRANDARVHALASEGIAYVPFYPLGGFTPLQSSALSAVAVRLVATPMRVALAWLLQRAPNILLIPVTLAVAHLQDSMAAAGMVLPEDAVREIDNMKRASAH